MCVQKPDKKVAISSLPVLEEVALWAVQNFMTELGKPSRTVKQRDSNKKGYSGV